MANSKSARTLSKPPPPPAIPLPPIPTQMSVPEIPPVPQNPPCPPKGQQTQQQPPPSPLQTPKRSLSLITEIPKPDSMCLGGPINTPDAVRAPLLSRTSRSIRRAFSAHRAPTPTATRRLVTTGQIGTPVLHKGKETMQALAKMGVTLDANGEGTIKAKVPRGSSHPKKPHERPHRRPVSNRGKSKGGSGNGEGELEKKRDKRRGFVFEPALEDGTTVEPLETVIAPLRVLDNVLEEGGDGESGHVVCATEASDGEVSPESSCEGSSGIFDDPIDKMRWSFLTPHKPLENVHGALGGIEQMVGGIARPLADINRDSGNLKQETPKQGKPTPTPKANLAGPVIGKRAPEFTNRSPPSTRPPSRSFPSISSEDEEMQTQRRLVEETVKGFERKISTSSNPSPPVPRPLLSEGKNKPSKSPKRGPTKETKRRIPPPLVFRKTGPSRPLGLPPIVIEQGNADVDLPPPPMDLYADKEATAPRIRRGQPKPRNSPIKASEALEVPKGSSCPPPVSLRPQPLSPLSVSVSPLQPRTAQNDDIPDRIKDPLTGIQYIPPAAPSPPMSPPAGRSWQEDEGGCVEEAALKEILSLEASREDFSQYLATRSNGNSGKLLELYMAAKAHEEALNLVMKLSEEIQVIATQIPFFALGKSNYPKNITMAQKEVLKRMVEEFPTYLMANSARPIENQRELHGEVEMEKQKGIGHKIERELEREGPKRGERRRRGLRREIEKEQERVKMEELEWERTRKLEAAEEKKTFKDRKDRDLKLQKPKEKAHHPKNTSSKTTQSQIPPSLEGESFGGMSYPDCIQKLLITKDSGPPSPIHRKKKSLPDSLGATMSTAQTTTTKSHQKLSIPTRRRPSIVRVASGSERRVHMTNSIQRKSHFPQQSHPSRHSLYPSIERVPSFSSSASEPEPELVNDYFSKVSTSDSTGSYYGEGGAPRPTYSSDRGSFAITRDEIIRLSKVLEGEDHLKIVSGEEYGGIVENLLELGDDEIDRRRDTTIGLYDLYDR
ncbi:hypothetical protein HOY82DRAFT_553645 [Tuber indicum]|nr:hypothetical protein HOY82DRAFT_553645 [Tuber indicum]